MPCNARIADSAIRDRAAAAIRALRMGRRVSTQKSTSRSDGQTEGSLSASALSASRADTRPIGAGNSKARASPNARRSTIDPSRTTRTGRSSADISDIDVAAVDVLRVAGARNAEMRAGAWTSESRTSAADTADTELQAVRMRTPALLMERSSARTLLT